MHKLNIFQKIVLLLLVLIIPTVLLFQYSNQVSINVIQQEIQSSNIGRLSFFANQLNSRVSQLSLLSVMTSHDTTIRQYQDNYLNSSILNLDRQKSKEVAEDMLGLQSASAGWTNAIRVYSPSLHEFVGSDKSGSFDISDLQNHLYVNWMEQVSGEPGSRHITFIRHIVEPYSARDDLARANTIVEMSFDDNNIRRMLDDFKSKGENDPFLYRDGFEPILNSTPGTGIIRELVGMLGALSDREGAKTVKLGGMDYLIVYQRMEDLGWYAIDYTPVEQIVTPITKTRNLFFVSAGLLLTLTVLAAIILYRNVQLPIRRLIRGLQQLKRGDLSARIAERPRNEFGFVFDRFNEMAEQMNTLINTVYEEKLRSREATLKQLQSQINPHFLYNCLAFITSMAKLKDNEAIIAMALNLGSYYRYATRVDNRLVPLAKELELVEHYLAIQAMRNPRIQYEIEVPDRMKTYGVPMLFLQPVVENAIVHGIEPKPGIGWIRIRGDETDDRIRLRVDDTGVGMDADGLCQLHMKITKPVMDDDMGCGIWNVHQRLLHQFGEQARMEFSALPGGGLRAELSWPKQEDAKLGDGGDRDANGNHRDKGGTAP